MNWKLINSGFNTGKFNMEYDLRLASQCKPGEAFLRLYRWKPFCISLGANQGFESVDMLKAGENNIDVVKRPTGGRAILHAEELTYSVILPLDQNSSARNIYHEINTALAAGLTLYDEKLAQVELENIQPNFRDFYKEEKSAVCFAVPAKSELKYQGKKLAGSAQRKLGKAVLQHGSILCGDFHKKIVDYLIASEEDSRAILQMLNSTADIKLITGKDVNYKFLCSSIADGFRSFYNCEITEINKDDLFMVESELIYP